MRSGVKKSVERAPRVDLKFKMLMYKAPHVRKSRVTYWLRLYVYITGAYFIARIYANHRAHYGEKFLPAPLPRRRIWESHSSAPYVSVDRIY